MPNTCMTLTDAQLSLNDIHFENIDPMLIFLELMGNISKFIKFSYIIKGNQQSPCILSQALLNILGNKQLIFMLKFMYKTHLSVTI